MHPLVIRNPCRFNLLLNMCACVYSGKSSKTQSAVKIQDSRRRDATNEPKSEYVGGNGRLHSISQRQPVRQTRRSTSYK